MKMVFDKKSYQHQYWLEHKLEMAISARESYYRCRKKCLEKCKQYQESHKEKSKKYQHDYYLSHKRNAEKKRLNAEASRRYKKKHPEYASVYYWRNPERMRMLARKSFIKHKEARNLHSKGFHKRLKLEALMIYGGCPPKCAYCASTERLTIDHRNNDGHLEDRHYPQAFLIRIIKEKDFEKYQVLCLTCNILKQHVNASKRLEKIKQKEAKLCQKKILIQISLP
jgi:hypothetical protein